MSRTHTRHHRRATEELGAAADVVEPGLTGDARLVAGGTVTEQARAGGHALVVGSAVVAELAVVVDHAVIAGQAAICGAATVSGHAAVIDGVWVGGDAWIFDRAVVRDLASVGEQAQIFGASAIAGQATVTDQAWIFGDAIVDGHAHVGGRARIGGGRVTGTARIDGDLRLRPGALVGDGADLRSPRDLHMLELVRRVHATLYRCADGAVGAGLPDGWHGRLDLDQLPEELLRHRDLIHDLAARWTPPAPTVADDDITTDPDQPDCDMETHTEDVGAPVDEQTSWARWAPPAGG